MRFLNKIFNSFKSKSNQKKESSTDIKIDEAKYDYYQMRQITLGLEKGLDVSIYADPKYKAWQMIQIRKGLEMGLDVSIYADPKYDPEQMDEMRVELASAVGKYDDIKNTYKHNFSSMQLDEIWRGLEQGLDVSIYADPKYDPGQMGEIRLGLERGLDVSIYADPKYDEEQMVMINMGLGKGLDVSIYADPKYNGEQMMQIILGIESGIDIGIYADPSYDSSQMSKIRTRLEKGLDISKYIKSTDDSEDIYESKVNNLEKTDISKYTDPRYDSDQILEIIDGLEDESKYIDLKYNENSKYEKEKIQIQNHFTEIQNALSDCKKLMIAIGIEYSKYSKGESLKTKAELTQCYVEIVNNLNRLNKEASNCYNFMLNNNNKIFTDLLKIGDEICEDIDETMTSLVGVINLLNKDGYKFDFKDSYYYAKHCTSEQLFRRALVYNAYIQSIYNDGRSSVGHDIILTIIGSIFGPLKSLNEDKREKLCEYLEFIERGIDTKWHTLTLKWFEDKVKTQQDANYFTEMINILQSKSDRVYELLCENAHIPIHKLVPTNIVDVFDGNMHIYYNDDMYDFEYSNKIDGDMHIHNNSYDFEYSNKTYDEIDYDNLELGESYDDYYDELSYVDTDY